MNRMSAFRSDLLRRFQAEPLPERGPERKAHVERLIGEAKEAIGKGLPQPELSTIHTLADSLAGRAMEDDYMLPLLADPPISPVEVPVDPRLRLLELLQSGVRLPIKPAPEVSERVAALLRSRARTARGSPALIVENGIVALRGTGLTEGFGQDALERLRGVGRRDT